MLTLMLLRHAKSSWTQIGSTDFERPLNERGAKTAPLIGRYLAAHNLAPARIYCSTARRAQATAKLALAEIPDTPEPVYDRAIYDGGQESLFNTIASTPDGANPVLVVGHNPTIHGLSLSLCQGGNGEALMNMSTKYPTGGLAIIDFDHENWHDIAGGSGQLRDFVTPRDLSPDN